MFAWFGRFGPFAIQYDNLCFSAEGTFIDPLKAPRTPDYNARYATQYRSGASTQHVLRGVAAHRSWCCCTQILVCRSAGCGRRGGMGPFSVWHANAHVPFCTYVLCVRLLRLCNSLPICPQRYVHVCVLATLPYISIIIIITLHTAVCPCAVRNCWRTTIG